jgi:hypothetical protein
MKLTVYSKVVVTQPVNTPNQSFALNTYIWYMKLTIGMIDEIPLYCIHEV